ncbi:hypothetical protein HS7_01390 [Sulfolobales archaeon HS-7]|nr:hypothetical protein HS7_01390 [Sulfolobales archaeon HS-7]
MRDANVKFAAMFEISSESIKSYTTNNTDLRRGKLSYLVRSGSQTYKSLRKTTPYNSLPNTFVIHSHLFAKPKQRRCPYVPYLIYERVTVLKLLVDVNKPLIPLLINTGSYYVEF